MKKTNISAYTKDFFIEVVWFWSSVGFILTYILTGVKTTTGFGINRKFLHVVSCLCLIATYASCIFFKSSAINIQKLLKDGNFRCLLVACSLLGVSGMLIPMLPFLLMSSLSVANYIIKNKGKFDKTAAMQTSLNLIAQRDQIMLVALKIEVLSLPLLFLHLILGTADLFVIVSYASMVWFEYTTNPCMKKAAHEIVGSMDKIAASPSIPHAARQRYYQAKKYIASRLPIPVEHTKTASSQ
ncbi:hypothetical protein NEMIN01_0796 [Nematocida minor]|uniref:uncharacterized protein n=1 Tax=Nematocida minor TaxID=1912983 RepID=UPI00221ECAEC|nr:uncharacterized protein NEMIN01_0796 [Nematocida minor]KAI5190011.1 hypothetical protein NEMIN01_0796 [Nematocida minor]